MKVIFLGTPDFAVKPLQLILKSRHEVVGVVTQPDKANRRGKKIVFSPVKEYALSQNIEVLQFDRIRDSQPVQVLKNLGADIMVSCAYGQIFSQEIIDLTPHGIINIHASLLPKYRGSCPVQWAIINGEKKLGVTTMKTVMEVDKGDMILQDSIELEGSENSQQALEKLSDLGGELIVKTLDLIEEGKAKFIKQKDDEASYCKMLKKEHGKIDFNRKAQDVVNFIRGMTPWPSAYTFVNDAIFKVKKAKVFDMECKDCQVGEIVVSDDKRGLVIKCKEGYIQALIVQGQGGKEMSARDYLRGKKIEKGTIL